MKRTWFATVLAALFLTAGAAFPAEIAEAPFMPLLPQIMAQGGASISTASGYVSLFTNPAGFSRKGRDAFTLLAANPWVYGNPSDLMSLGFLTAGGVVPESELLGVLNDQVTGGGFGVGTSVGIGLATNGLGLGALVMVDSYLQGPTFMGMKGSVTGTVGMVGGLAFPLDLFGIKFHFGADVRPMVRIRIPVYGSTAAGLLSALASGDDLIASLNSADAVYGLGIGIDAGMIVEWNGLAAGISVRDLAGTTFRYSTAKVEEVMGSLGSQVRLPEGTATEDTYVIPMDIGVGVSFHPDLGDFAPLFDPSIQLDVRDLVGVFKGLSPWMALHVGAEVKLLSLFSFRAGINQGYVTMGAGLRFLFLDVNFGIFTRELGARAGDRPSAGATIEAAVRF